MEISSALNRDCGPAHDPFSRREITHNNNRAEPFSRPRSAFSAITITVPESNNGPGEMAFHHVQRDYG
jgi:hypothetical protein